MGIFVNVAPVTGVVMVAPLVGGAVEIVPWRPIEPVADSGGNVAARAACGDAITTMNVTAMRYLNHRDRRRILTLSITRLSYSLQALRTVAVGSRDNTLVIPLDNLWQTEYQEKNN